MITVLCANAGIDKTYEVPNFAVGGYYHPSAASTTAGGKGINVARVLLALGQPHLLTRIPVGDLCQHLQPQPDPQLEGQHSEEHIGHPEERAEIPDTVGKTAPPRAQMQLLPASGAVELIDGPQQP